MNANCFVHAWVGVDLIMLTHTDIVYARRSKSDPLLTVASNNAVDDVIVVVATATITTIFSSDWLSLYTADNANYKAGWP